MQQIIWKIRISQTLLSICFVAKQPVISLQQFLVKARHRHGAEWWIVLHCIISFCLYVITCPFAFWETVKEKEHFPLSLCVFCFFLLLKTCHQPKCRLKHLLDVYVEQQRQFSQLLNFSKMISLIFSTVGVNKMESRSAHDQLTERLNKN